MSIFRIINIKKHRYLEIMQLIPTLRISDDYGKNFSPMGEMTQCYLAIRVLSTEPPRTFWSEKLVLRAPYNLHNRNQ